MLGTRGVRLGVIHPEIYEMQIRAIIRAAKAVKQRSGEAPTLEIMIPLVAYDRRVRVRCATRVLRDRRRRRVWRIRNGLPDRHDDRAAARLPDRRTRSPRTADFFSFGTNDLTQAAIGFSRDDVEKGIIPRTSTDKILNGSPFQTIDQEGVGALVQMAVERGRAANAELHLGICGEHGGDPESIHFFHDGGSRLRQLLAVPPADRARRRGPGDDRSRQVSEQRSGAGARPAPLASAFGQGPRGKRGPQLADAPSVTPRGKRGPQLADAPSVTRGA